MNKNRIDREIAHGKHLSDIGRGELWYWSTPAGQIRFKRRLDMLSSHIQPHMKVL